MLDKEKILKEQRVAEAVDRNYMGLEGKFGVILKYLGQSIMAQGSANYESTDWIDVYDVEEQEGLPEQDPDTPIHEIGKTFDGLKYGYHIELSYLKNGSIPIKLSEYQTIHEDASKVLKVSYKGYLVYLEAEGDLHIFTPNPEWEDIILKIYLSAEKLQKTYKFKNSADSLIEAKKNKLNFLERLRDKWGI